MLGTTLDELPPQTRRLLGLVRAMVVERAEREGLKPAEVRFTRREVRAATAWSDTQLKVHLARLTELEYLIVRRATDGRHAALFVYELAYGGEGDDGSPFLMGLIDAEALAGEPGASERNTNERRYDTTRSARTQDWAGSGRPGVGRRSEGGRVPEHVELPSATKGSPVLASAAAPKARSDDEATSVIAVHAGGR